MAITLRAPDARRRTGAWLHSDTGYMSFFANKLSTPESLAQGVDVLSSARLGKRALYFVAGKNCVNLITATLDDFGHPTKVNGAVGIFRNEFLELEAALANARRYWS